MSVQTSADDALNDARHSIANAIKHLSKITVDRTWGYDDFCEERSAEIHNAFKSLLDIREKLGDPR